MSPDPVDGSLETMKESSICLPPGHSVSPVIGVETRAANTARRLMDQKIPTLPKHRPFEKPPLKVRFSPFDGPKDESF
jgi:hypothetical protein